MSKNTLGINNAIQKYLVAVSLRESDVLRQLREETARHPGAIMQIGPEQGQFMALLVQLIGAKKTLEVGVFTGYSSLCVALALPPDGKIIACDISKEDTAIARRYWEAAGVANKIELKIAPALSTLDELIAAGEAGTFDFAFIDADKANYANYYERSLQLLRPGGLIVVDNVLFLGKIANPLIQDNSTRAIRAFNEKLHYDERVTLSLVPVGDGLTLAMKR